MDKGPIWVEEEGMFPYEHGSPIGMVFLNPLKTP